MSHPLHSLALSLCGVNSAGDGALMGVDSNHMLIAFTVCAAGSAPTTLQQQLQQALSSRVRLQVDFLALNIDN